MKTIHYINLGTAKAGTSAIFNTLCQHPKIDHPVSRRDKENYGYSHFRWSLEKYVDYYKNYNVSMNFNTSQWGMESKQIKEFETVFTHASMVFRNPYDFIESQYNFLPGAKKRHNPEQFVDMLLETNSLEYAKTAKRWTSLSQRPFLILFHEDLTSRPDLFYNRITNFIGIGAYNFDTSRRVNVTQGQKTLILPTTKQINIINSLIDQFEDFSQRLLSHRKR